MNTVPDISKAEVLARQREDIVEAAVGTVMEQGPMREAMRRGTAPAPPPSSFSPGGDAFFTFGNALDGDGAPLQTTR